MPDSRASRFAFEVLFLVALAIAVVLADLRPLLIAVVMLVGWVIVALLEWAAWRDEPHYASGLPPRYYVPPVSLPPRQPLEQVARYPSAEQRDEAPTWIASAALRAEVLGAWPVAPAPAGEDTQAEEPAHARSEDGTDAVVEPAPELVASEPEPVPELAAEREPEPDLEREPERVAQMPAEREPEPEPEVEVGPEPEPEPVVAAALADEGDQTGEGANGSAPGVEAVAPAEVAGVDGLVEPDEIAPEDNAESADAVAVPRRRRFWHRRHEPEPEPRPEPEREPDEETDPVSALHEASELEPAPADAGAVEVRDVEPEAEPVPEPAPEPEPEPEPEPQIEAEPEPVLELVAAAPQSARHRLDPLAEPEVRRWPWQRRPADDHSVAEVAARPTGPRTLPGGSRRHDG